jgi:uncharacterized protein (DUF2062 family)
MIFKRRESLGFFSRVRGFFAPRKGWRRGFRYIGKRVQRLPDTPHRIALGFSCGVVASFTPLFTMHFVVGFALAWLVRGNLLASAFGTFAGNPVTFPFIALIALSIGEWLLSTPDLHRNFDFATIFHDLPGFFDTVFWPYLLGGLAPGLLAGGVSYILVRPVIAAYQNRRRGRLTEAARRRVQARRARNRALMADAAE